MSKKGKKEPKEEVKKKSIVYPLPFAQTPFTYFDDEVIGKSIKETGYWEEDLTKWLLENIEKHLPNSTNQVLDVGAHVGYFSVLFANCLYSKYHIHAFEPNLNLWNKLITNTIPYPEITVYPYGIKPFTHFDEPTDLTRFYMSKTNTGDNTVHLKNIKEYNEEWDTTTVAMKEIECFPINYGKIGLVKIDVQGDEWALMKEIRQVATHPKTIYIVEKEKNWSEEIKQYDPVILFETEYDVVFQAPRP